MCPHSHLFLVHRPSRPRGTSGTGDENGFYLSISIVPCPPLPFVPGGAPVPLHDLSSTFPSTRFTRTVNVPESPPLPIKFKTYLRCYSNVHLRGFRNKSTQVNYKGMGLVEFYRGWSRCTLYRCTL